MSEDRSMDVVVAFGAGIVVGAAAALLMAPATGAETRRRISEFGQTAADRAGDGMQSAKEFAAEQAQRIGQAVREGKEAYKKEIAKE
jgi:gas vesicle protein